MDGHTAPHLEQITTIFIRHLPIKKPWRGTIYRNR
nr:MAG TPA: hypothetical protein [Caudoviricetes sp.]